MLPMSMSMDVMVEGLLRRLLVRDYRIGIGHKRLALRNLYLLGKLYHRHRLRWRDSMNNHRDSLSQGFPLE
jgi:hypothetical protein